MGVAIGFLVGSLATSIAWAMCVAWMWSHFDQQWNDLYKTAREAVEQLNRQQDDADWWKQN